MGHKSPRLASRFRLLEQIPKPIDEVVSIGVILKKLEDLGLAENTLVIFTSDHGEMLGDHGMHSKVIFYEG